MKLNSFLKVGLVGAVAALAVGCATLGLGHQRHQRSNNLFKYLYSDQVAHVDTPTIPTLSLPLRVGIAFVPMDQADQKGGLGWEDPGFTEAQKTALLKKIGQEFKAYPFVKSVDVIPSAYLTPRGGFANLDQLRSMYGVDVMALVSFDQVQFTDEDVVSLAYWTIVGMYVFEGEKNDTKTMLDGAVYDIASRKLLFRAPGTSTVTERSTPVNLGEELRRNSQKGFDLAATNLVIGLKAALAEFQTRVKESPTEYKVVHKPGYTGAGSFSGLETASLGAAMLSLAWLKSKVRR